MTPTEGERWAREEVARLRADRFSPAAIWRFLAASQRRANATRRRRPADWARAQAMVAAGAAAWALAAVLIGGPFRRAAGSFAGWWALVALMLDWHLGMFETEDGAPRSPGPADALTLGRAWLVPLVAEAPTATLCLAALATDGLDGAIARRTAATRAGRDLEGLVDACFAAAALRGLRRCDRLSAAPAIAEGMRVASGVAYAAHGWLRLGRRPPQAVTQAARTAAPARTAGLGLAARGHRRTGDLTVVLAAAVSTAAHLRGLRGG